MGKNNTEIIGGEIKWQGKSVGVLGFGISGRESCLFLLERGAEVVLYDESEESKLNSEYLSACKKFEKFSVVAGAGAFAKIAVHDFLVMSSGIKLDKPEFESENFKKAEKLNEEMIFINACPENCNIVGVTGSNGKSTTVSLLFEALKVFEEDPVLCGNIGISPLKSLRESGNKREKNTEEKTFSFELSSAALEIFEPAFALPILAITNITPNHLDRHGTMENYAESKLKGASNETEIIVNLDDEGTQKYILPKLQSHKYLYGVSLENTVDEALIPGIYLGPANDLVFFDGVDAVSVYNLSSKRKLLGSHNLYNIAFVLLILCLLDYDAVEAEDVINNFVGLEHRIEFVAERNGIKFLNDSKSTTPDALVKAIEAVGGNKNICLIAGGDDKKVSYDMLLPLFVENIKHLSILKGSIDDKLQKLAEQSGITFTLTNSMEEAVADSEKNAEAGDIVLLSPGSSSHNMFNNFEHRGKTFKSIVLGDA